MLRLMEAAGPGERGSRWEGWWQRELSAWASTLDPAVVLDAPDDVLLERVRAWAKPHDLKELSGPDARKELAKWRALLEDLMGELQALGEIKVLRIDTGEKSMVEAAGGTMRAPRIGDLVSWRQVIDLLGQCHVRQPIRGWYQHEPSQLHRDWCHEGNHEPLSLP